MFKGMFNGSNWAGIVSLLIFFSVFVIAMVMVFMKKESDIEHLSHLPLDDEDTSENKN